jgi:hypothetical protein
VARDEVRVDRQAQHPQPAVEVVLPHRRVPLGELLAAPDVVDEHVQPALLGLDAPHERLDQGRLQMVNLDRDSLPAGAIHELGGLLDRLGPVVLRAPLPRRAPRAVDRRACLAQRHRRAPPGPARRARDERHLPIQLSVHGLHPPRRRR